MMLVLFVGCALSPRRRRSLHVPVLGIFGPALAFAQSIVVPDFQQGAAGPSPNRPGAGFPGATAAESNAAFPEGQQPANLASWPRNADGTLAPCSWLRTVLRDTNAGWPGTCDDLTRRTDDASTSREACRLSCAENPACPVWQFVAGSGCWQGGGRSCFQRRSVASIEAQRLLHGDVRVIKDMLGWQVLDLYNLGVFDSGTEGEDLERCRQWCYSNIYCQYWQYGRDGCFVDAPNVTGTTVQYPLTSNGGATDGSDDSDWVKSMVAGEYIEHICYPRPTHVTQAPQPSAPRLPTGNVDVENAGISSFQWVLIIPIVLLVCCVAAYLGYKSVSGTQSQLGARGVRDSASDEEDADGVESSTMDEDEGEGEGDLGVHLVAPESPLYMASGAVNEPLFIPSLGRIS